MNRVLDSEDDIIETPNLYYAKNNLGNPRIQSYYLRKYCDINDSNISRFVEIVDRNTEGISYRNLQRKGRLKKVKDEFLRRIDFPAEEGEIEIIRRDINTYYYELVPYGEIHTVPYKPYYANKINNILAFANEGKARVLNKANN